MNILTYLAQLRIEVGRVNFNTFADGCKDDEI